MTMLVDQSRAGGGIRVLGGAALAALAAITAVISYQHGLEVVRATGTTGWVAYLVPLVADLMIAASSLDLLDAAQRQQPRPRLAMVALAVGITATLAMNVASGWHHGYGGALVSALAPLALVLAYETLMGMVRRGRQPVAQDQPSATLDHAAPCPHGVAQTVEEAALSSFLHGRDCLGEGPSQRQVCAAFAINRKRLSELVREHDGDGEDLGAEIATLVPVGASEGATP